MIRLLFLSMALLFVMPVSAQSAPMLFDRVYATTCGDDANIMTAYFEIADQNLELTEVNSTIAEAVTIVDAADACNPDAEAITEATGTFTLNITPVAAYEAGTPFALALTFNDDDDETDPIVTIIGVPVLEDAPDISPIIAEMPWSRPTLFGDMDMGDDDMDMDMGSGMVHAVYGTFINRGEETLTLIGGETTAAAAVEVHETVIEDDIARMRPITALEIAPGEAAMLAPAGLHIMLVDLQLNLREGDAIPLTLFFEDADGDIIEFVIAVPVYDAFMGVPELMPMAMSGMDDDMMMNPDDGVMTLNFVAAFGDEMAVCGGSYSGVGADEATVSFNDFRFYVSNIQLITADGAMVPFELEQDGIWQVENVALLDFEDGSASCSEIGNAALNGEVRGTAPAGEYVGLQFDLGVPFELNHADVLTAPSPLNIAALWWNWQGGYKFIRVDLMTDGADPAFNVHLGSTGCDSPAAVIAPQEPCSRPNMTTITLDNFNMMRDVVVADMAGLLAETALYETTPMPPGCMSGFDDPDCPTVYAGFGLSLETGACLDGDCTQQQFFRVGTKDDFAPIGRTDMMGMAAMDMDD